MTIGSLGSVVFRVSTQAIKTIKTLSWKTAINYSVHKMHGRKGLLEYTGQDPDEIEFEADVSALLGVNPLDMIKELRSMAVNHAPVKFLLGTEIIGTSWVITDVQVSSEQFFQDGAMLSASLQITIKEYTEE